MKFIRNQLTRESDSHLTYFYTFSCFQCSLIYLFVFIFVAVVHLAPLYMLPTLIRLVTDRHVCAHVQYCSLHRGVHSV